MSTETVRPLQFAGIIYTRETPDKKSLWRFAEQLRDRGFNIQGIMQENVYDENAQYCGMNAIDIKTGEKHILSRPSKEDLESHSCGFDPQNLTACAPLLEKSISERADLLIVEKFGEREQNGTGFMDEILQAAMAGVPTLVTVPATAIDIWQEITGPYAEIISYSEDSFWKWWSKWNLYQDLAHAVEALPILEIEIGENALFIETDKGCAALPRRFQSDDLEIDTATLKKQSLKDLAQKMIQPGNDFEFDLGLCACLAFFNTETLIGSEESGLTYFENSDDRSLVIGPFPKDKFNGAQYRFSSTDHAGYHLQKEAFEGVIMPSSLLAEARLPSLLEQTALAQCVLVGPETPLCPRLFQYGIHVLSGRVITERQKAREMVKKGAKVKDLKSVSRYVSLEKPAD